MKWVKSMGQSLAHAASSFRQWRRSRQRSVQAQRFGYLRVDEFPDALKPSTVYVAGEGVHIWAAAMLCPCGCGDVIELNLLRKVRPCWSVREHADGTVSLTPSVWRRKGCRSHFFILHGRIDWYRAITDSDDV